MKLADLVPKLANQSDALLLWGGLVGGLLGCLFWLFEGRVVSLFFWAVLCLFAWLVLFCCFSGRLFEAKCCLGCVCSLFDCLVGCLLGRLFGWLFEGRTCLACFFCDVVW